ncbi:MAG: filamentous hemagglutinin N-terminal domain-containing protein [Candidatus Paceibacterota bacterium]|jgi:filamentous hemagglutinin family protein
MIFIQHGRVPVSRNKFVLVVSIVLAIRPITMLAAPADGVVVSGSADIGQAGTVTNITQHTEKAAINWQGFSVNSGETVNFQQPDASSITLNRVLGNEKTVINGALNANGQIFLINSNGVLFSHGSSVNAAGLVASTLDISNAEFEAGHYVFQGKNSGGSVLNLGTLNAADGGYVALLGKEVINQGVILATLGTAALSAGGQITLNFNGDSLLSVSLDRGVLNALVENREAIYADGGKVLLTARAADELLGSQVNNSGLIEAHTLGDLKGEIVAHAYSGSTSINGTLDASAPSNGNGGFIETSGDKVTIADSAYITTRAALGKTGNWLIDPDGFTIAASGGDISGTVLSNALALNNITFASTQGSGTNGNINVNDLVNWSAPTTLGLIATHSININAAITGRNGGLLLNAGLDINLNAPTSVNVPTLTATANGDINFNAPQFWSIAGNWNFSGNNINFNDTVNWSAGLLTLNAAKFINLNAVITANDNAKLVATYNTGKDASTDADGVPTSAYGTPLGGINALFDSATQEFIGRLDFVNNQAANPLTINGNQYTLITSIGGSGTHDLSVINANSGIGYYALATDLTAPNTAFTTEPVTQLGGYDDNFQEIPAGLEGLGHAIINLNINIQPNDSNSVGLIGGISKESFVSNINLANISVSDLSAVNGDIGTLVGRNNGFINNAYASGIINVSALELDGDAGGIFGVNDIGGFAGYNDGIIYSSGAAVDVTAVNANFIGGFVGLNFALNGTYPDGSPFPFGVIVDSYATGAVDVTISNENAANMGMSDAGIGGFVGTNYSLISASSSSGAVNAVVQTAPGITLGIANIGGFAGVNTDGFSGTNAVISNSTSTSSVTASVAGIQEQGFTSNVGGFVGLVFNSSGRNIIINSSAFGAVQAKPDFLANSQGVISRTAGGFAGSNFGGTFFGNSFNTVTSGQNQGIGVNNSATNSGITNTNATPPTANQGSPSQAQLARDARAQAQSLTDQATVQRVDSAALAAVQQANASAQIAAQAAAAKAAAQAATANNASQLASARVAETQRNFGPSALAGNNIVSATPPSPIDQNIVAIEPGSYSAHVQSIEVDGVIYNLEEEEDNKDEKPNNPK